MKTAEEYILHYAPHRAMTQKSVLLLEELIKQCQIDAIEETVILCAEKAEVNINGDCDDKFSLRSQDGEWLVIIVNEDSILNCAEILKKQIV